MAWFFLALFFAFWTSITFVISKRVLQNAHPLTSSVANVLFITPFMFLLVISAGGFPKINSTFEISLSFSVLLDILAAVCSFWAIKMTPISLLSPLGALNPVFTTLVSIFTLKEIPSLQRGLGILLIVIGAYILNASEIKNGLLRPFQSLLSNRGVQLYTFSQFLWAITPSLQKIAIQNTLPPSPLFTSFVSMLLGTVLFLPIPLLIIKKRFFTDLKRNLWWFLLPAPISALAFWAAFSSFSLTYVSYSTAIFKLSILFTVLWGYLFFREERIKERFAGSLVILLGVALLIL